MVKRLNRLYEQLNKQLISLNLLLQRMFVDHDIIFSIFRQHKKIQEIYI